MPVSSSNASPGKVPGHPGGTPRGAASLARPRNLVHPMRAEQRSAKHPRRERIPQPGGWCTGDGITLPAKVGYTNGGKAGGCATTMPPDVECGGHLTWSSHVPCGRKPSGRALLHRSGRMRSTDEGCAGAAGQRIIVVQVWATVGATIHLGQGRVSAGPVAVAGCALCPGGERASSW